MDENEDVDLSEVEEFGIYDVNSLYVGTMANLPKFLRDSIIRPRQYTGYGFTYYNIDEAIDYFNAEERAHAKAFEELYDITAWKKANFDYFNKIFKDCDKWKKQQEERESTFRKKDISELRKSLHELMRKTWPNPDEAKQEFEGRWLDIEGET